VRVVLHDVWAFHAAWLTVAVAICVVRAPLVVTLAVSVLAAVFWALAVRAELRQRRREERGAW
jgi:hypothetical protein